MSADLSHLPSKPGVYLFYDQNNTILYVGKAVNLRNRVRSYFQSPLHLGVKTAALVQLVSRVSFIEVESEIEALLLESSLVQKYMPKYNVDLKDGKRYPYIRISTKDELPTISIVRQKAPDKAKYFGPFPTGTRIKSILRLVRSIFLYHNPDTFRSSALFFQLGYGARRGIVLSDQDKKAYRWWIGQMVAFLSGKHKKVITTLKKEMKKASQRRAYEESAELKGKIEAIERVLQPVRLPSEYEEQPSLRFDLRTRELEELRDVLASRFPGMPLPERIECYDISNIQGSDAVGSMVVLLHGEPASSEYKRFKIRGKHTPDDPFMMGEVIRRRFSNDWPLPDLVVVDGGMTQLNAARAAVIEPYRSIPFIGLAKRLEEIVVSDSASTIILPKDSKALQVLQRIRDEAHRFALAYHRLLRRKRFLNLTKDK